MPLFKIEFERLSKITDIETIGRIKNRSIREWLNQNHGKSKWLYKKGTAKIRVSESGNIWIAEIHFYTAHGQGIYREEVKYLLKRVYE